MRAASGTEDAAELLRLARCTSPEIEAFLQARAADAQVANEGRDAALAALGVLHELPQDTALHLLGVLGSGTEAAPIRAQLRAGNPFEALRVLHGAAPGRVPGLGRIHDARINALLHDLRDRRELGCHAWAVGELALQGDAAARAEMQQVCGDGRYGWIDDATPEALTLGFDLRMVPALVAELESNCCRCVPIDMALLGMVGIEFRNGAPWWVRTEAQAVRGWFQRFGVRLRWSRLAERWVVV